MRAFILVRKGLQMHSNPARKAKFGIMLAAAMLAALLLGLAGCGQQGGGDQGGGADQGAGADQEAVNAETTKALSGKGVVSTFIGEPFYDGKVTNEDEAIAAVESVMDRIGGDETTRLEINAVRPTETGTTYYTLRQRSGEVLVIGASAKLIVDKDGNAIGLVASILPDVHLPDTDTWIEQSKAEEAVRQHCTEEGVENVEIVEGATMQTAVPFDTADGSQLHYAWVVYTPNYNEDAHLAYLAHYIDNQGDYLYSMAVAEPNNANSLAGDAAAFEFDKYQEGTWSGTVTKNDGSTVELTVPTLTNPENGEVLLADAKRKIVCADYADFTYNDLIAARIEADGKFDDQEILIYDCFIRVWDFYNSIGWTGPDGEGTPTILLMDMVTEGGDVIQNACYSGRKYGFQTFAFNRLDPDGECTDIVAHEFTHCVTATTMTSILYINDFGAINEAMSDILGNLVEMLIDYNPDGAWLIGENEGTGEPYRSMKDPHAYNQPEFVWDQYYVPAVAEGNPTTNDNGGVHINSSPLNIISYKLDGAGMPLEDQFYFWMNVALAITPETDFPIMAELLPWCMEQAGYPQYVDALKAAISEAAFVVTEPPATPPAGCGIITFAFPDTEAAENGDVIVWFKAEGVDGQIQTHPAKGTNVVTVVLPAGDYHAMVNYLQGDTIVQTYVYDGTSWKAAEELAESVTDELGAAIPVADGAKVELSGEGIGAA